MKNDREQRVLNELLEELENVRIGRSVRRKATGALAAIALVAMVIVLALPSQPNPGSQIAKVIPSLPAPVVPEPERVYEWLEIVDPDRTLAHVDTSAAGSFSEIIGNETALRFVEFMDDTALVQALRETGSSAGVARVNGRVILTGSVKTRSIGEDSEESDGLPAL